MDVSLSALHTFPKVFLWYRTKITPSQSKADNGLPTSVISRTDSTSTREMCVCVCVWSGVLLYEGQERKDSWFVTAEQFLLVSPAV